MKLPGIQYGPVQGLGRYETGGPMRAANAVAAAARAESAAARAEGRVFEAAGDVADAYYRANAQNEAERAASQAKKQMDEMLVALDKPRFSLEEVRKFGVEVEETETVTDEYGRTRTVPRQVIGAEEVLTSAYDIATKNIGAAVASNIKNPLAQADFVRSWRRVVTRTRGSVLNKQADLALQAEKGKALATIEDHTDAGRYEVAIESIRSKVESGLFSELEAAEMVDKVRYQEEVQPVYDALISNDIQSLRGQIDRLVDPDYEGPLDGKDRSQFLVSLRRRHALAVKAAEVDTSKRDALIASNLEIRIDRGDASVTHADIDRLFMQEVISGAKRTQLYKKLDEGFQGRWAAQDRAALIEDSYRTGLPLDPGDAEHRKAVDEAHEANPTFANGLSLLERTGVLASRMRSDLTRLGLSSNPADVQKAVEPYRAMVRMGKDHVLDGIDEAAFASITGASALMEAGMDSRPAIELVRKSQQMTDDRRKQINQMWTGLRKENEEEFADYVDDNLDVAFWGSPALSAQMLQDFQDVGKVYFQLFDGDVELAREATFAKLRQRWGTTQVGGEMRPMAYPPEKMTGFTPDQLNQDLDDFLEAEGMGVRARGKARIFADRGRATPAEGYRVWIQDQDTGALEAARGKNGMPLYYRPSRDNVARRARERHLQQLERANDRDAWLEQATQEMIPGQVMP